MVEPSNVSTTIDPSSRWPDGMAPVALGVTCGAPHAAPSIASSHSSVYVSSHMSRQSPLVFIMAAGLGTRMKSDTAKVLHRIAGRPMLHWVVTTARAANAARIVAILGHQLEAVKASLDAAFGVGTVEIAHQAEQRGTGHAVQSALPAVTNEPDDRIVVILTGDAPLLRTERITELVAAADASPSGMALLSTIPDRPMPYGRLVRNERGLLAKIVEHPDA